MPHLYFHVAVDGTTFSDETGFNIPEGDLERQVRMAAAAIAGEQAASGRTAEVIIEVSDERGTTIMVVEADSKAYRVAPTGRAS